MTNSDTSLSADSLAEVDGIRAAIEADFQEAQGCASVGQLRQIASVMAGRSYALAQMVKALAADRDAAHERGRAAGRTEAAGRLRYGAEGRRAYMKTCPDGPSREVLDHEASTIESAAAVASGNDGPLYSWLPAQMWSPEMHAALNARDVPGPTNCPRGEPDNG